MKKTAFRPQLATALATLAFMAAGPSPGASQNATFTPYGGYRLGGTGSIRGGDLKLDDAPFFGGQLDFRVRPDGTGALWVDYQPTTLRLKVIGEGVQELFDIHVWYFQGGGTLEVMNGSGPVPFVLGSIGASWFDPKTSSYSSEWGFSGVFGAGAKLPLQSGGMALRLQARVLLNSIYGGGSLWCGTGSGCYVGVGGPIGPVQFDFGGGLTFGGR